MRTRNRSHVASPAFLVTLWMISCLSSVSQAALPPGYEDDMWCPPRYCARAIQYMSGLVGPQHIFQECYLAEDDSVVDEIWTGSLTNVAAPEGWVENPEACPEPRIDEDGAPDDTRPPLSDEDTTTAGATSTTKNVTTTNGGDAGFNTTSRCNPVLGGGRRDLQDGCADGESDGASREISSAGRSALAGVVSLIGGIAAILG